MSKSKKIIEKYGLDKFLPEMANLDITETGISKGYIWVSTQFTSHSARIKYYPEKTGKDSPNISISISKNPRIVSGSKKIIDSISNDTISEIKKWIIINYDKLMYFWDKGTELTRKEVNLFFDSLEKI